LQDGRYRRDFFESSALRHFFHLSFSSRPASCSASSNRAGGRTPGWGQDKERGQCLNRGMANSCRCRECFRASL
jgi:hypothetical protein